MEQGAGARALVLYSGGLDSAVVLAQAVADARFAEVKALTFDYGQTCRGEVAAARRLTSAWGIPHEVHALDLPYRDAHVEIPARNTIFLAYALQAALTLRATHVLAGWEPGSRYADSTWEYIKAQQVVFERHGVTLLAPVKANRDKASTLHQALALGVPLDSIHPCRSDPVCFECRTCEFMRTAWALVFPRLPYRDGLELVSEALSTCTMLGDEVYSCWSLRVRSFKLLPALFLLAQPFDLEGQRLAVTTGNWGIALLYAKSRLLTLDGLDLRIQQSTKLSDFKRSDLNTDHKAAQYGIAQALSHLPRPRYLRRPLTGQVTQGHLRACVIELGYEWSDYATALTVRLVTEG